MRRINYDPSRRDAWPFAPFELASPRATSCCHARSSLMVADHGFVWRRCTSCGSDRSLPPSSLRDLGLPAICPCCGGEFAFSDRLPDPRGRSVNLGALCPRCELCVWLADFVKAARERS